MEGTLFSTAYQGLPFVGGQPLPHHNAPWPRLRGVRGPRYPSARVRAVGPSESSSGGKCRRCMSGVVVEPATPDDS
jgi:hypothetical protein